VIAGLAAAERRGLLSFGRTAEFVGGMSYSLYLVHPIFIGLTAHALMNASIIHHLPELGVAALCVVAALTGAAGIYVLIEKPMLAWLQSIGRATRPRLRSPEPSTDVPGVR
jgi:peptidoglycan/LPS O-acetylase OafA/YrhL